jgi:hypothetical protein
MHKPGERHKRLLDIFAHRNTLLIHRSLRNAQGILANQIFTLLWRINFPGVQHSTWNCKPQSASALQAISAGFAALPEKSCAVGGAGAK